MPRSQDSNSNGRLNLEQQKKRAKELLQALKLAHPIALQRFQNHHPEASRSHLAGHAHLDSNRLQFSLSDAQLVIAREQGLPSWAKLKAHLEQLDQARQAIAQGSPVSLDTDCQTLHIRCGSDIQHKLAIAGFSGDFLEFADPYCQGPVPACSDQSEFLAVRANFIAQAYQIERKDAQRRLEQEYDRLHQSDRYRRVVLWFEHDAYDQLILAYILHYFATASARPAVIELICVNAFPGIQPFIGLGQLPPEALRTLWPQRQPITSKHLQLGDRVWRALTAASPAQLARIAQSGTPALPAMARALQRHLQELPWRQDGLSLTQRLTLELLVEQETLTGGQLFRLLTTHREPLPYLGDTMYWHVLSDLQQTASAPFEILSETASLPWAKRRLRLNSTGQALLARQVHWLQLTPLDRWVGGIHLNDRQRVWLWDEVRQQPVWGV
ncbi:MAG: DUF1835 domain-containing protein [Elainellaceae cyanobacterium]